MKGIIIEDKSVYSNSLKKLLRESGYTIDIVAEAKTVEDAIDAINKYTPHILFLDIQLQQNDSAGFEILDRVKIDFHIIFTTAFVDENIANIRLFGLHFLIKPYVAEELNDALKKIPGIIPINIHNKLEIGQPNLAIIAGIPKIIMIEFGNSIYPVYLDNIVYLYHHNNAVVFVVQIDNIHSNTNGMSHKPEPKKLTTFRKSLSTWENQLHPFQFCLVHQSYLVNMKYIVRLIRPSKEIPKDKVGAGGSVILVDGTTLPVSENGRERFLKFKA